MKRIEFRPAAVLDLAEAALWYENERPTLGWAFDQEVQRALSRLEITPKQFPEVEDGARRAMLDRFPYGIYFFEETEAITILGIFHLHRDPKRWKDRL